jgi:hypothetical protein
MKGPTPNANTSKRPKVLHTERRAVMIETFVEFLLRITLYVSADSAQDMSAILYITSINQRGRRNAPTRGQGDVIVAFSLRPLYSHSKVKREL